MEVKMVVMDLDNTLLKRDKTISPYTISVLKELQVRGILVAYATSRSAHASRRFRREIQPDVNITSCGAKATTGEKVLFRAAIPIDIATELLREFNENRNILQITVDTEYQYYDSKPLDENWIGRVDFLDSLVHDFSQPLPVEDIFRITLAAADAATIREIARKYPGLDVFSFTGESWHQVKSRKAAKEIALSTACKELGIDPKEVVAFGDDHTDVGMLRYSGCGVAMENAIPECKKAAGHTCGDCDEDGVARWLDEKLLRG